MLVNLIILPLLCAMVACAPQVQRDDPNAPPPSMWQWPPGLFHAERGHPPRHSVAEKHGPIEPQPVAVEMPPATEMPAPVTIFAPVPVDALLGKGREAAVQALGSPDTIMHSDDESRLIYSGVGCRVTLHYYRSARDWHWHLIHAEGVSGCRIAKKQG